VRATIRLCRRTLLCRLKRAGCCSNAKFDNGAIVNSDSLAVECSTFTWVVNDGHSFLRPPTMTPTTLIAFLTIPFAVTNALLCSLSNCTFERIACTEASPCGGVNDTMRISNVSKAIPGLNDSIAQCKALSGGSEYSLPTPVDQETAEHVTMLCNSTFIGVKFLSASCDYMDIDEPTVRMPYKAYFAGGEPSNANRTCEQRSTEQFEPCVGEWCDPFRAKRCGIGWQDRPCSAGVDNNYVHCILCAKRIATSTIHTTSSTSTTTTATIATTGGATGDATIDNPASSDITLYIALGVGAVAIAVGAIVFVVWRLGRRPLPKPKNDSSAAVASARKSNTYMFIPVPALVSGDQSPTTETGHVYDSPTSALSS
jgi:hypothetical protein